MILQYKSRTAKPKIYIASFQVAQLQSHLKGDYVNFGFAVLVFMLQDHCNLLYVYTFPETTAASNANETTLETLKLASNKEAPDDELLPPSSYSLDEYKVPHKFVGESDLLLIIRKAKAEGIVERMALN